ncbi:hypothetical protein [Bacteroides heparinolyticus]|uniref:hypothetical protein n=1 Tax=Prevotella heparinolytica TaxID=28113 RepID=UPI003FA0AE9B
MYTRISVIVHKNKWDGCKHPMGWLQASHGLVASVPWAGCSRPTYFREQNDLSSLTSEIVP